MATRLILLSVAAVFVAGCGSKPPPEIQWRAFSASRAYAHVQRLVDYGPRPAGSEALGRASTYITMQLQECGLTTEEQVFRARTPRGPQQFRNVVGKTRRGGADDPMIIIGSHYDTLLRDKMRFVGANDGGSSVGVLLEIARVASTTPNVWFAFFDGEEAMVSYGPEDGLWGSKFFVEQLKADDKLKDVKAMVLLDMVGDASLNITVPPNGSSELTEKLFEAARQTGNRDYFSYRQTQILDDHVPFLEAGVPALDIIDFEFGSAPGLNDYWHTEKDSLEHIRPRSLEIVGQTTLRLITLIRNSFVTH